MGSANPNTHWPWWFRHIAPIAAWPSPGQSRSAVSGMGWIQEGIRNLSERLEDAEDYRFFEDFRKSELRQRERLLKMEQLAKMEVGKDAGMGWIQEGVRNLSGRLDKALYDWIGGDFVKTVPRQREDLLKMEVGKDAGMGWIQEGVRNLFERLEDAEDDPMFENFKKSELRQSEHLLKMEQLAKMEVGKDAGMGRIQEGIRNSFGRLDNVLDDWILEDCKKIALREQANTPAEMQVWKLWIQRLDKEMDDFFFEDCKKIALRELAELPATMKEWERRIDRLDKRMNGWGRDFRKWIDGDFKKISRGTLELELRRLELERMQVEFLQRRLRPRMMSGMMDDGHYKH